MTTDDNAPDGDLAPHHEQALARVPAASEAAKKAHIDAALEHLGRDRRWPGFVAAAITVAAAAVAAFAVGRATAPEPTGPIVAGPTTTIAKTGLAFCNDQFADDAVLVHSYEVDDVDYAIVESGGEVFIVDVARCTYITQFPDSRE
jgi:hypothetical protein